MSIYSLMRPALFLLPPEQAHRAAICALQRGLVPAATSSPTSLHTQVAGLSFDNPVGLAPGFDKNAECFEGVLKCGFGFVEIGTVTPRPQPGNPQPRLFRLVEQEAIINRLGFNNEGMDVAAARLAKFRQTQNGWRVASYGEPERSERGGAVAGASSPPALKAPSKIIGGNIGKNKDSADALSDYTMAMRALYPHVDYITANISSPNTPGLRALQAGEELHALILGLQAQRAALVSAGEKHRPIFVKIAPDCDEAQLAAIAEVARDTGFDGLIVSNTTITRGGVEGSAHASETGGLSGKPLFALSTQVLRRMYQLTEGNIPLIGVGGIASAEDAYAKIRAGASLVQLYSAIVYQGIGLVGRINQGLAKFLVRDGFARVSEAVGRDA